MNNSIEFALKESHLSVVTIQEQQPFGQDRLGHPHHAVFFNQVVVGGVLAQFGGVF